MVPGAIGGMGQTRRLIVAAGDRLFREALCMALSALDYRIREVDSAEAALAHLREGGLAHGVIVEESSAGAVEDPRAGLALARAAPAVIVLCRPEAASGMIERWGAAATVDPRQAPGAIAEKIAETLGAGTAAGEDAWPSGAPRELSLGPDGAEAVWKGRRLDLSRAERALLGGLVDRPGRSLTYRRAEALLAGIEAEGAGDDPDRVVALVRRLRKKFREVDPGFDRIVFVPGRGYCWREPRGADPAPVP